MAGTDMPCDPRSGLPQASGRTSVAHHPAEDSRSGSQLETLHVVVATRLLTSSCPLCRQGNRRLRRGSARWSQPVNAGRLHGQRMIEHDRNTAAQQAGYPVGEEHDPDPPALEQGTGRDLTCAPRAGATPCGLTGRALVLKRGTDMRAQ